MKNKYRIFNESKHLEAVWLLFVYMISNINVKDAYARKFFFSFFFLILLIKPE